MKLAELESLLSKTGRNYPPVVTVGAEQFREWIAEMQPVERWSDPHLTTPNVYAPFRPRPLLVMSEAIPAYEFLPAPVEHGPAWCTVCRSILNGGSASRHLPVSA